MTRITPSRLRGGYEVLTSAPTLRISGTRPQTKLALFVKVCAMRSEPLTCHILCFDSRLLCPLPDPGLVIINDSDLAMSNVLVSRPCRTSLRQEKEISYTNLQDFLEACSSALGREVTPVVHRFDDGQESQRERTSCSGNDAKLTAHAIFGVLSRLLSQRERRKKKFHSLGTTAQTH